MTEADVIKLLLGALGVAGSVIAFLFYRIEKAISERDKARTDCEATQTKLHEMHAGELKTLHEAHKAEMRENGKALLAVTQQLTLAIEHLKDLDERRRQ